MGTSTIYSLLVLCYSVACFNAHISQDLFPAKRLELDKEWQDFKGKHGKQYQNQTHEDNSRAAFEANHDHISKHNSNSSRTFDLGHNEYSDMTINEVCQRMNGHKPRYVSSSTGRAFEATDDANRQLVATIDWRDYGYVTPVKNQGQCQSCWAFATTGVIEGLMAKTTGKLVSLSEQQILDCDMSDGGCDGGNAEDAYIYIHNNMGLDTEACYPYKTAYSNDTNSTCHYSTSCKGATIDTGYIRVSPLGNEAWLMYAVFTNGPIAIALDASHTSFQLYSSGVYSEPACSSSYYRLDHAVLLVGFGTYNGNLPVWIIKNSWGTSWGESGYMYLARNANNMCGVATDATFPNRPFTASSGF